MDVLARQELPGAETLFGRPLTALEGVREILASVREGGVPALLRWTRTLDGAALGAEDLWVGPEEMEAARERVDPALLASIRRARERIEAFHRAEPVPHAWHRVDSDGLVLGQEVRPLRRVGLYVPGGRAPLFSSLLMGAVPARVAGVGEVVVATPPRRDGSVPPAILAAAAEAGVARVLRAGGAQAVAALAYGLEGVLEPVEKIVGPGNLFVTLAKREVFGQVGIDGLPGPSEVLVVADATANPEWVAADLLAQAEHDPDASAVLVTASEGLLQAVEAALARQLQRLDPQGDGVARRSLERWGKALLCRDLAEAVAWAGRLAPEHLELAVEDPWRWVGRVGAAGAIFLGHAASEPLGDYLAGPDHILPTNGAARFSSGLSVETFLIRSSLIGYSDEALRRDGPAAVRMARAEGLEAHARAVEIRLEAGGPGGADEGPAPGKEGEA
ncbi:histidinol dehydrogenase [Limnochorda pilosa]|uniref:Histidinol dehydrogenase n=1 Tax=Limnochorda pilosa TaxID=1555112 RepID=A0A0K2SNT6_LIMPI|nr:histidinol dehydrogenase [Limnochorda pilosa]